VSTLNELLERERERDIKRWPEASRLLKHCRQGKDEQSDWQVKRTCSLWGGKGFVYEITTIPPIIIKYVSESGDPLAMSLSDRRKAESYQVEANFYERVAPFLLEKHLKIPRPLYVERRETQVVICMSKLTGETPYLQDPHTRAVLQWLATLHAATWGGTERHPNLTGLLQPVGTYWHLDTRPDEHASMKQKGWQGRLKLAARALDNRLKRDSMQCCCHGDAKEANMLFSREGDTIVVGMYDFQYAGWGTPTRDLSYFLSVAAHDNSLELLRFYHTELLQKLGDDQQHAAPSFEALQDSLEIAYADWVRFQCGWGFWGADLTDRVISLLDRLDGGSNLGTEEAYEQAMQREYG
jgi:hypothetical protein